MTCFIPSTGSLWHKRYPNRTLHLLNVFSRLAIHKRTQGVFRPHHNKNKENHRSVHIKRHDSLKRREKDSELHSYRMPVHKALMRTDF